MAREIRTMTYERKKLDLEGRLAGEQIINEQAGRQVRTFLDELRNGTRNYRTVASLGDQVAQEYRGRAVLELLQNAHDVLGSGGGDRCQVSFMLNSSSERPELLIGNSGRPFRREDLSGICQLAQSPKDPNESVGNKGLGFRSVLELTTRPEVWSTAAADGDPAFTFGFDPEVLEPIARMAQALMDGGTATDPAFGQEPVVDWSRKQIEEYRNRLSRDGVKRVEAVKEWLSAEVREYLSPYVLPRFLGDPPPQVARLLENGHVTVVRLPLDGGRAGSVEEAVNSVREQLVALDEAAMVFLPHLSLLRREIDEEVVELKRQVVAARTLSGTREEPDDGAIPSVRHTRLRVGRTGPDATAERSFHVWSRALGGADQPAATERIAAAVRHLPNRWPEVRKVEVALAVEETGEARQGALVIFLPTTMKTGIGALVNAPSYGSLDRKTINFGDAYNELMLEFVTDLALDAVLELVGGPPEPWRGRAVIDLLAQAGSPRSDGPELTRRFRERARDRDEYPPLEQQALILCDGGWQQPSVARTMPNIPVGDPFGEAEWRAQAGFAVASSALDARREPVEALLRSLGSSPRPRHEEWAGTVARMAEEIDRRQAGAQADPSRAAEAPSDWNRFLSSVLSVLPSELRSEPKDPDADPLAEARFLPTEDGRLRSASDTVRMFFRPRHGADDAADFVGSVPISLKERIAFLHHDVQTHAGPQRRRTEIQKFLDGRFVQSFRREDLLREVIIPSLPELPAQHGSPEALECADALAWTLEVIGQEVPEGLLNRLAELPVACTGGWFAMKEAVFGAGWSGRSGDHLKTLADGLSDEEDEDLLRSALLPPGDDRWTPREDKGGVDGGRPDIASRADLFARVGVVDGLRLKACDAMSFWMSRSDPKLPDSAPSGIPQAAWDDWKETVLPHVKPQFKYWLEHELQGVSVLPILHREHLGNSVRTALSNLVLASLAHWKNGWEGVSIKRGKHPPQQILSPLKHWLTNLPWLVDGSDTQALRQDPKPLRQRWLVPESLLRWTKGQFRHLSPLSVELSQRLGEDEGLRDALVGLGLNVYPTDDAQTGPALLEALADVAERLAEGAGGRGPTPAVGFDILLGQIRRGWIHLSPEGDLPTRFVVRKRPRTLTVCASEELSGVYLPDHGWKTRLLRQHGQPIVAMRPQEASNSQLRDRLIKLGARRAAGLEEHCRIDHGPSAQAVGGAQALAGAGLGWLPVVLLTLQAHGGGNPAGPDTKAWREAANRLRRSRVLKCDSIEVELVDAGQSVAHSEPRAHWLARDRILVVHREVAQFGRYEEIAAACQAILDRQDLLKDLRLVLSALHGRTPPTQHRIEAALDRAEIDAVAVANIRRIWDGETSLLVRRIRPVLQLLGVSPEGLDRDGKDMPGLTEWLSENTGITGRPVEELVAAARECHDDFEMGYWTWRVLGDSAELPKWNEALSALGDGYEKVRNDQAEAEAKRYLDEAAPLLRAFARHVAKDAPVSIERQGELFSRVSAVHEGLARDPEWRRRLAQWSEDWWVVPFDVVLGDLRARYESIAEVKAHLGVLEGVTAVAELRSTLKRLKVGLDPDPREVAHGNQSRLNRAIRRVGECYETWVRKRGATATSSTKDFEARLDVSIMSLREWPDKDLFRCAKRAVDDSDFYSAVKGCATIEEMLDALGLTREDLEATRRGREQQDDDAERKKRTVEVAGEPFEIGGRVSYSELFARLRKLPDPVQAAGIGPPPPGPDNDGKKRPRVSSDSEIFRRGPKTSHRHGPPDLPGLVGIVGEMHAFRFLQANFDIDIGDWVSESRTRVVPLLDSEQDVTSDSLGYDFRFTYSQITWCVEVKATTGDGTGFDLPPSELNAATRIAPRRNERWRILRVVRALTKRPECYWLPNPLEPGPGERLRLLRQGGVTVEYQRPEHTRTSGQREADDNQKMEEPTGNG